MSKTRYEIIAILLSAVILTAFVFPVCTLGADFSKTVNSGNICVYNTEYKTVVYEKNAGERLSPGPTAKIMTAIVALEYFSGDLEKTVTVSPAALKGIYGSAVIGLAENEQVRAIDLIYATVVGGASDAANAIACAISGSPSSFAVKMNQKAKELGAADTLYQNPSGLDEKGAYTTARDTAIIAAYALTVPKLVEIANTSAYKIPKTDKSDARTVYTRNMIITNNGTNKYYYSEAKGLSAGYTDEAGYCAVAALQSGFTYVCVAMNAQKAANGDIGSYIDVKNLLGWAKNNFAAKKVLDKSQVITELPVELSSDRSYVTVVPQSNIYAFLPADADVSALEKIVVLQKEKLTAPVKRGEYVGDVVVFLGDTELGATQLVTKLDAQRSAWLAFKNAVFDKFGIFSVAVVALIAFCVIFAAVRFVRLVKKAGK